MTLISILAGLAGIWFLAVTIPGPNFIVVSQSSMSESRKSGFFIALGVSTAASIWATSSLLGLKALFEYAYWLYDTIRILGGIYLVYMGVKIIRNTIPITTDPVQNGNEPANPFKALRKGMFTSFSNPKTAAFFGSIFVTTFPPEAPLWAYVSTIIMVFSISVAWYSLVAFVFSLPKIQQRYLRIQKNLDKFTGTLLIILGVRLAFSRT